MYIASRRESFSMCCIEFVLVAEFDSSLAGSPFVPCGAAVGPSDRLLCFTFFSWVFVSFSVKREDMLNLWVEMPILRLHEILSLNSDSRSYFHIQVFVSYVPRLPHITFCRSSLSSLHFTTSLVAVCSEPNVYRFPTFPNSRSRIRLLLLRTIPGNPPNSKALCSISWRAFFSRWKDVCLCPRPAFS